jgi:heme-degrading monooxygenase HmoA
MASRFELNTYRKVLPFFVAALRVYQQTRRADGAIGVTLKAHPLRREFFTLSTWRDRAAVNAMVGAEPHLSVMNAFRTHTADAAFVFWIAPPSTRPTWTEAHRRLADQ